jgi:hypothetical protein
MTTSLHFYDILITRQQRKIFVVKLQLRIIFTTANLLLAVIKNVEMSCYVRI